MSRQDFTQDWVAFRDPILTTYPELTEADLQDADGSTLRLAERIAERRGIAAGDAQQELHEFLSGPMPADAYAAPTHDNVAVSESDAYVPAGEDVYDDDRRFGDDDTPDTPIGRDR